jgi:DNA-binding winged helix-turn-helix (wHTH) protein/tetratricopeptide (TPR) repeat protein
VGVFNLEPADFAIDLGKWPEFRIGGISVRPAELLVFGGGIQRELQPRVMQVLIALARASPNVVSRERLFEVCWEGRVVGEDALNRCILALRHLSAEFPGPPFSIQTIPRVGHRLLEHDRPEIPSVRFKTHRWLPPAGAILALALIVATVLAWTGKARESSSSAGARGAKAETAAADSHVANLYQTASNLIRTRSRGSAPTAVNLLKDAIKADPTYAPAWARLGEATLLAGALNDSENFMAAATRAQAYVSHALRLDPDLAEAHRAMGALVGFGSPRAVAHSLRAAQIDPTNPENLVGLGAALGATGDFEGELAAYRRAHEIDPSYFRAVAALAVATAEMGHSQKAELIARDLQKQDVQRDLLLGKIAWISGDYSEAIRRWSIVEASESPRWSGAARRYRDEGEQFLKIGLGVLVAIPRPLDQRHLGRIGMLAPPSPDQWRLRNRSPMAAAVYRDENHVAAKLMLNAGRWQELVSSYDGPGGVAGVRSIEPLRPDQVGEAPVAILALRQAGRSKEADRLVHDANLHLASAYARGQVPAWLELERAAILALQGKSDLALNSFARAIDRGWRPGGSIDLDDLSDEPAFRSLRNDRRFQKLLARLAAEIARERRETQDLSHG